MASAGSEHGKANTTTAPTTLAPIITDTSNIHPATTKSDTSTGAKTGKTRQRTRPSICRMCDARRVKCNAGERIPCSNCERARCECRLVEPKRGKKKRNPNHGRSASTPIIPTVPKDVQDQHQQQQQQQQQQLRQQPNYPAEPNSPSPRPRGSNREELHLSIPSRGVTVENGPSREVIFSHSPQAEALRAQVLQTTDQPAAEKNNSVKLESPIVYLGETFNLTYLLQQTSLDSHSDASSLHYIPPIDVKRNITQQQREEDPTVLELLGTQGAFLIPPTEICQELYHVYFTFVQPHYPILDRQDFATRYANPTNPPSYLLLQAVLFMAAGHCDIGLLRSAGFKSRHSTRSTLFKRAKALYDADHETDKVTIIQALFLMSFQWNHPMDQKDNWYWLGNAINLALSIGMHRSTKNSNMPTRNKRLWRKIWWSLFTEDKHAAAALGRLPHVRLKDCDIDPLTESDFEEGQCPDADIFGAQDRVDMLYVIALSDLSKIVERIIEKPSSPCKPVAQGQTETLEACEELLEKWEAKLPPELSLGRCGESLWVSMLHVAYNWFRILAHRTRLPEDPSTPSRKSSHKLSINAADRIVRIVEDIIACQLIHQCPIHVIPSLFATMGVHAGDICSGNAVLQHLGHAKILISMKALRQLQGTWPISGWVFLLFTKIILRIRDRDNVPVPAPLQPHRSGGEYEDFRPGLPARRWTSMTQNSNPLTGTDRSSSVYSTDRDIPTPQSATDISFAAWDANPIILPLNFSVDWVALMEGDQPDLWPDPEFEYLIRRSSSGRGSIH